MTAAADVAAMVLGANGGARLARALGSVAWAGERVVIDPAGRIDAATLPPTVRRLESVLDLADATDARWLLLLGEDEVAAPELAAAIVDATTSGAAAYRIGRALELRGVTLRLPRAPIRLARRDTARLHVGAGASLALGAPGAQVGRVASRLVVEEAASLEEAVEALDADAAALAALLDALGGRPRFWALAVAPLAAAVPVLAARGGPVGWGRWIAAVLAGYRAFVVQAKLWERRGEGGA